MAGVLRVGVLRFVSQPAASKNLLAKQVLPSVTQSCTITGKTFRGKPLERPKPYPYQTKGYNILNSIFDKTTWRFDENSKIVVVDGPIAAGKSAFGKALADELEMLFMPEPTLDRLYVNKYGYDLRQLNKDLPPNCRSFENKDFLQNPKHPLAASFQIKMLWLRYSDYVDALAHLMSTGQGVVLERSVYSDIVFLETMFRHGYISKNVRSYYNQLQYHTMPELMKPHLVIYLDVPVAEVKNRIKKRNIDYEVNSPALTDDYLKTMESIYKQQYLKDISTHAELLVYDWSNHGEVEVVVEDIERIDFDRFEKNDSKLHDWRMWHEEDWNAQRMIYADKPTLMNFFNVPRLDVPELLWTADETTAWSDAWYNAPGNKYRLGFNEEMGDTNLLWKSKMELRNGL
jgi:NADH dehydrogenase (ubiquinone) 1 alpha subcomplex subunit 10